MFGNKYSVLDSCSSLVLFYQDKYAIFPDPETIATFITCPGAEARFKLEVKAQTTTVRIWL